MQLFSLLHLLLLLAVARSNPTRHGRNTKSSEKGGRANIPNQKAVFAHFMVSKSSLGTSLSPVLTPNRSETFTLGPIVIGRVI